VYLISFVNTLFIILLATMTSSYIKQKLTPYPSVRQPKDYMERQTFRTERVLSSRFLDNNHSVELHKNNFWKPSGFYLVKQ
jgi:hypothetical protein